VTTLELDVVITKDKQVVVSHEPWMNFAICTTPEGQPITEKQEKNFNIYQLTYNQVKQFDTWVSTNLNAYKLWCVANNSLLIVKLPLKII
jgi:glycerophosphoryl diester phosphodiesterase